VTLREFLLRRGGDNSLGGGVHGGGVGHGGRLHRAWSILGGGVHSARHHLGGGHTRSIGGGGVNCDGHEDGRLRAGGVGGEEELVAKVLGVLKNY
jgi:hypothetical protein